MFILLELSNTLIVRLIEHIAFVNIMASALKDNGLSALAKLSIFLDTDWHK